MTARFLLENMVMWSAQILLLVAAAALACRWLPHARARLYLWQGVLLASLLLPLFMPVRAPEPILVTNAVSDLVTVTTNAVTVKVPNRPAWWGAQALLWIVGIGIAVRLVWLLAGVVRLHLLRNRAVRLTEPPIPFDRSALWYVSDAVAGPVTFGWLNPTIVLPRSVLALPRESVHAIASHELIHVFRCDWLFVLAEEVLRSLLWFHPAIWYALNEVQISREELVDAEAVKLTEDREQYLDALLAVAERRLVGGLAPAPLFLKKRQLARRIAAIVQETRMSKWNLTARIALVVSATAAGLGAAAFFFPFPSAAQAVPDDPGISVQAGAQLLHRPTLRYPEGVKAGGVVVLDATLNNRGEVTDARVVSGPEELRRSALTSVLAWHYSSPGAPPSVRIMIQFGDPAQAPPSLQSGKLGGRIVAPGVASTGVIGGPISAVRSAVPAPPPPPPPPPGARPMIIKEVVFRGIDAGAQEQLRSRIPVRAGDEISPEKYLALIAAMKEIDQHLVAMFQKQGADGDVLVISSPELSLAPPPPPPSPPPGTASPILVRVGGLVQAANLLNKVTPAYPPLAKQARIQGTVRFNVDIGADGSVQHIELVSGHPLLVPSAYEALKQWTYKPTLLNGAPVDVSTTVDINFTLSE